MTEQSPVEETWADTLFHVRRSVRYHMRREAFFDRWHRFTGVISIIAGSAAFAMLMAEAPSAVPATAAFLIVFAQALDLYHAPGLWARKHFDFRRRFLEIECDMIQEETPSAQALKSLKVRRLSIEAEEPPILRALDLMCHNDLLIALGYNPKSDPEYFVKISWIQRRLAQFIDMRSIHS